MSLTFTTHLAPSEPLSGTTALLVDAFAAPPYGYEPERLTRRMDRWASYADQPGFRVTAAHRDGRLVGIAWGWDSAVARGAGPASYQGLYDRLAAQTWADRLVGTEVVEVAVAPSEQGGGVGGLLLDGLVDEQPAWLMAWRDAPAARWYQRHGWTLVGELDGEPPLLALARPPGARSSRSD